MMIKEIKNIVKNFSFLFSAQIIYKLLSFFTFLIIARCLGASGFGQFSFAISFVALFNLLVDLGLNEFMIRDLAGEGIEKINSYIKQIFGLKILLAVLAYGLMAYTIHIMPETHQIKVSVLLLGLVLIFDSLTIFLRTLIRLFEKMGYEALSLLLEGGLKLLLVIIVARNFATGVKSFVLAFLIVSIFSSLLSWVVVLKKFGSLKFLTILQLPNKLFWKAFPFAFLAFFGVINFKIDIIMLSRLTDALRTGWYAAAVKLIEPILVIPSTLAIVLFPVVSRIYKNDVKMFVKIARNTLCLLLGISVLFVIILTLLSGKIINLLFGVQYQGSILILTLLNLSLIPFFVKFFLERTILCANVSKPIFASYLLGTGFNIVLNFVFVRNFGFSGVAVATIISELIIVLINAFFLQKLCYNIGAQTV